MMIIERFRKRNVIDITVINGEQRIILTMYVFKRHCMEYSCILSHSSPECIQKLVG